MIRKPENTSDSLIEENPPVIDYNPPLPFNPTISKEIPVDAKEDQPQNVRVDFQEEDFASQYASQQTHNSDEDNGIDPNTPADKLQEDIADYEESKTKKYEYKDFVKMAEFIITLIDTGLSMTLNWWAKDSASSAYSMPASNKKLLIDQLALILAKYQTKFSIEFTFFVGLVLLYAPAALAANKNRKQNILLTKKAAKEEEKQASAPPEKKPNEPYFKYKPEADILEKLEVKPDSIEKEKVFETIKFGKKRKPGKQPKAW